MATTRARRALPTRARRTAADAPLETSRERIHDAALRLFAQYGYDGTSLQMIADEVGLHKSTLFHHYASKLDVAKEAFEVAMARVAERVRPLAEEESPRLESLLRVSDSLSDHFCAEPDAARMIAWIMTAARDSDLNLHIGGDPRHPVVVVLTTVWTWLERARRAGAIRPANLRQAIFNLIGLVVFYPAAADAEYLSGEDRFSPKARRIRREELRLALRGMFEPR